MAFPIRYSVRAYNEYEKILDYVFENFGVNVTKKVDTHFEDIIAQISVNPNLYPYTSKIKNLRRCVVSPQTTIYYRFNGEFVEIASFRGNKMNPKTIFL